MLFSKSMHLCFRLQSIIRLAQVCIANSRQPCRHLNFQHFPRSQRSNILLGRVSSRKNGLSKAKISMSWKRKVWEGSLWITWFSQLTGMSFSKDISLESFPGVRNHSSSLVCTHYTPIICQYWPPPTYSLTSQQFFHESSDVSPIRDLSFLIILLNNRYQACCKSADDKGRLPGAHEHCAACKQFSCGAHKRPSHMAMYARLRMPR